MADRPRKRKSESALSNRAEVEQPDVSAARSDEGTEHEYADEEYALKRRRNNAAVNKTRQKKRQEEFDTVKRVNQLREENTTLERTVESMKQELNLLKEMVLSFASNRNRNDLDNDKSSTENPAEPSK